MTHARHSEGDRIPLWLPLGLLAVLAGTGIVVVRVTRQPWIIEPESPMRKVGLALDAYRMQFRAHPPDTGYGLDMEKSPGTYDPGSLWRYLAEPVYDPRTRRTHGPFLVDWERRHMKPYDDALAGPSFYLTAPSGNPYGFVGRRERVTHNAGSFDLFSAGPDGVTACNNGLDDDGDGIVDCSRDPLSSNPRDNRAYNGVDDDGDGNVDHPEEFGPEAILNGNAGDDVNNWSAYAPPPP